MFIDALPADWRAAFRDHAALAGELAELWRKASAAALDIDASPAVFARLLVRALQTPAPQSLAQLPAAEFYVIAGCLAHQDRALRAFEAGHFGAIDAGLARMNLDRDTREEVKQQVREKLYVARADGTVPLEEYAGKGSLNSFLRVMATRLALNLIRGRKAHDRASKRHHQQLPVAAAATSPALALIKQTHRRAFEEALAQSAAALDAAERNLLRLHLVDCLSIDELAALKRIHRSTAARRIARIRTKLGERTRDILGARLALNTGEFTSIVRLVQSELDVSMRRLLQTRRD